MTELSTLTINPKTGKLLVIDVQNDVCDSNSAYANSEYAPGKKRDVKPLQQTVENSIIPFLERARGYGLPMGFVQSIYQVGQYSHSGIHCKWLTIDLELEDPQWRIKIYRDMPKILDPIFRKDTQYIFMYKGEENGLDDWLNGTEDILVAGFTTDGCVKKGLDVLVKRGYKPIVLKDCVATSGHKINTAHMATLDEYKTHEIIKILDSRQINF